MSARFMCSKNFFRGNLIVASFVYVLRFPRWSGIYALKKERVNYYADMYVPNLFTIPVQFSIFKGADFLADAKLKSENLA